MCFRCSRWILNAILSTNLYRLGLTKVRRKEGTLCGEGFFTPFFTLFQGLVPAYYSWHIQATGVQFTLNEAERLQRF